MKLPHAYDYSEARELGLKYLPLDIEDLEDEIASRQELLDALKDHLAELRGR